MSPHLTLTSPLQDLGQGQSYTSQHVLELTSAGNVGGTVPGSPHGRLHILQHQPTSRPIEDRFSVDIVRPSKSNRGDTILLGVYDGHRGPWTADHVAKTLPEALLALEPESESQVATRPLEETVDDQRSSERASSARTIKAVFQKFDRDMISTFQKANSLPLAHHYSKPKSVLRTLIPSFHGKGRQQPPLSSQQKIDRKNTPAALRVQSGCTASMLKIDFHHDASSPSTAMIINLGDSRTVIAKPSKHPEVLASSTDVCSSSEAERILVLSQHPNDDPADVFVSRRLFGDTLSTRAFGDAMYKLPLRTPDVNSSAFLPLNHDQKQLHKHLITQLSAYEQEARHAAGNSKTIPMIDRYDYLFSRYKTPPYVSAEPDVTSVLLDHLPYQTRDETVNNEKRAFVAILASDGLWDLLPSEEAVKIVCQTANSRTQCQTQASETENLAQILLHKAIEKHGRHPGDDVTILVLELF